MYIFRTQRRHIDEVVRLRKHALNGVPNLLIGDRVLLSETIETSDDRPPIRYVLTYFRTLPDLHDETVSIWGKKWTHIIEFSKCRELANPFDIRKVQVSNHEYGPGGPIVRVHPADEYEIERLGLLAP